MIDKDGFRHNVGIILVNKEKQLFWGKRVGQADAWQFPQGGIHQGETLEQAMYRELHEELGLDAADVEMLATSRDWVHYYLPKHLRRHYSRPLCIGQKQKWVILDLIAPREKIRYDKTATPEFSDSRWVDYWWPLEEVISFKREVYRKALQEFEPIIFPVDSS